MSVTRDSRDTLESMIDEHGIGPVIGCLAKLCGEKAEHVRVNWQDESLAKAWENAGCALDGWAVDERMLLP